MKKFILILIILVFSAALGLFLYYREGIYIDFRPDVPVTASVSIRGKAILVDGEAFTIKGVDLSSGLPGKWPTDYAVDRKTYLRWLSEIQEMGANTVRIYSVQSPDFYKAFHDYNSERQAHGLEPLYLLQGVAVDDYAANSSKDAFDREIMDELISDGKMAVDVVHGARAAALSSGLLAAAGIYTQAVSRWVLGYIVGRSWNSSLIAYTNLTHEGMSHYQGKYLSADSNASPFENMLAEVGDAIIAHESSRYKQQRLIAFGNSEITDPFKCPPIVAGYLNKVVYLNVEHIKVMPEFLAGQFAAYSSYPYYPNFLHYMQRAEEIVEDNWNRLRTDNAYLTLEYRISTAKAAKIEDYICTGDYGNDNNTWRAYLSALNRFHSMPVVIAEFGSSSGRGIAQMESGGRNQGNMSETEQAQAIMKCWEDIQYTGCAGGCIFEWQDEWALRSWNTLYAVDTSRTPFWHDEQAPDQYFGLLSFDIGKGENVCTIDGKNDEWTEADTVFENDTMSLSIKYDAQHIFFLLHSDGFSFEKDLLYVSLDVTPNSGSTYCESERLSFNRPVDFIIKIHGRDDSRITVHEYYEALRTNYAEYAYGFNTYTKSNLPQKDSTQFVPIELMLQPEANLYYAELLEKTVTYETGILTYGNNNPDSNEYNSLADFCSSGEYVEIAVPWQLLNFSDPSKNKIHDDSYSGSFGLTYCGIDGIYAGLSDKNGKTALEYFPITSWGNHIDYYERLKPAYYALCDLWR